jgi:hypothetical protein
VAAAAVTLTVWSSDSDSDSDSDGDGKGEQDEERRMTRMARRSWAAGSERDDGATRDSSLFVRGGWTGR